MNKINPRYEDGEPMCIIECCVEWPGYCNYYNPRGMCIPALRRDRDALKIENERLNRQVEPLKAENLQLKLEIAAGRTKDDKLEKENEQSKKLVNSLEALCKNWQWKNEQLEKRVEELEKPQKCKCPKCSGYALLECGHYPEDYCDCKD